MRCLGIPNTAHFANVTNIEDAMALWEKIKVTNKTPARSLDSPPRCRSSRTPGSRTTRRSTRTARGTSSTRRPTRTSRDRGFSRARATAGRQSRCQAGTKEVLESGLDTRPGYLKIQAWISEILPGNLEIRPGYLEIPAWKSRNTTRTSRNMAWLSEICLPAKTVEYFLLIPYFAFVCRKLPQGV